MALLENLDPSDEFDEVEAKIDSAIDAVNLITAGNIIAKKVMNIGVWDMDSTPSILLAHGLDPAKILGFECFIIDDNSSQLLSIFFGNSYESVEGNIRQSTTQFAVSRRPGGAFDGTGFNDSSMNRGYIIITYLK